MSMRNDDSGRVGSPEARTKGRLLSVVVGVSLTLTLLPAAHACPKAAKLIDFNCDSVQRNAVTGDSIVRGVVDDLGLDGYVGRLGANLPNAEVLNIGVKGITSRHILQAFKSNLRPRKNGTTFNKSRATDIFIIAVGVNDYWAGTPPEKTVTNIRRLVKFLRARIRALSGAAPYIAIATLAPNGRVFQRPFVAAVNSLLLKLNSPTFPVQVRFDALPEKILSEDLLHPNGLGYDLMTTVAETFIRGTAQREAVKLRPDEDHDGVFDLFEQSVFGTDPLSPDTDGDLLTDKREIFRYRTNPLNPDSDGDGVTDYIELKFGADPLTPKPVG